MKFGDLRVYNRDFELLAILPKYLSVNWEIKFKEFGLGEIELERTNEIVALLTENKYLFLFQDNIQAIVSGYKIGEKVTVFLRTLEWLLTKYAVKEFKAKDILNSENCTISSLLEYILANNLHDAFKVQFVGIENDESDMSDFVSEDLESVYSLVRKVISDDKYGFIFRWDKESKRFVFSLLLAKENNNIILCDEYKTAYESEYNFDLQKEVSGGMFYQAVTNMGEWNASTNVPELYVNPDNYGKYYTVTEGGYRMGIDFVKGDILLCKNTHGNFVKVDKAEPFLVELPPEENGIFSFSGILVSRDIKSADKEIKDSKVLDMLRCKTRLSYMEDFDLGDIIKVNFFADNLSCQKKKIISEIHLWDEPDGTGVMPTTIDIS